LKIYKLQFSSTNQVRFDGYDQPVETLAHEEAIAKSGASFQSDFSRISAGFQPDFNRISIGFQSDFNRISTFFSPEAGF
jgi:hypothetical protein